MLTYQLREGRDIASKTRGVESLHIAPPLTEPDHSPWIARLPERLVPHRVDLAAANNKMSLPLQGVQGFHRVGQDLPFPDTSPASNYEHTDLSIIE